MENLRSKDVWFEMSVMVQNIGLDDVDQQQLKRALFDVSIAMSKDDQDKAWSIIQSYKSAEYAHRGDATAQ
jgi:hypothetical protein